MQPDKLNIPCSFRWEKKIKKSFQSLKFRPQKKTYVQLTNVVVFEFVHCSFCHLEFTERNTNEHSVQPLSNLNISKKIISKLKTEFACYFLLLQRKNTYLAKRLGWYIMSTLKKYSKQQLNKDVKETDLEKHVMLLPVSVRCILSQSLLDAG